MMDPAHGGNGKAKAIFACSQDGFWREFDVPGHLVKAKVAVSERFHLKPLAAVLDGEQRACILLVDRSKARVFELNNEEVTEKQDFVNELTRRGKSDGFGGYDAGHAERRETNEASQHFKVVAEHIEHYFERGGCDRLLIGCHDESWADIESQLLPLSKKHLIGHFRVDPKTASPEQIKEIAREHLAADSARKKEELIREVIGEAHRNGRGAIGLRRVMNSLEMGEVLTLLLGSNFHAAGVKCYHCGHMDYHIKPNCEVCGKDNTELEDIGDAIVGHAIRTGVELVYVPDDEEFDKIGRIAALLRFRADQNTGEKIAS